MDEEREDEHAFEAEGPMEVIRFKLTGRTMLLMNSAAGVNPLNPLVKQKSILTSKKPKQRTDEDISEIYRLDFVLGMYHDEELGPYIPGVNLEAAILVAAKIERMGPKAQAGVRIFEDMIPLKYKGPRGIKELWEKQSIFADIRQTKLKASSSLMKCRPCFPKGWTLEATCQYNGAVVDRAAVERWIKQVGDVGICDYRKRFGKSVVQIL